LAALLLIGYAKLLRVDRNPLVQDFALDELDRVGGVAPKTNYDEYISSTEKK
jgi:hypothetical protein